MGRSDDFPPFAYERVAIADAVRISGISKRTLQNLALQGAIPGAAKPAGRCAYSDEVGRVFRPEVGHRADVKRATYSDAKRAIWDAPAWVVGDILSNGAEGQASSAGAHRLRRLSPARSMRYAL